MANAEDGFRSAAITGGNAWRRFTLQIKLMGRMLGDWRRGQYPLPLRTVIALGLGAVYVINPMDLVPDTLPVVGILDDALVVGFCFSQVRRDLRRYCHVKGLERASFGL